MKKLIPVIIITLAFYSVFFLSCKKSTPANQELIGTYAGVDTGLATGGAIVPSSPDTATITAGSNGNSIIISLKHAGVSCTANLNSLNFETSTYQTETIGGATGNWTCTGSLTGTKLLAVFTDSVFLGNGYISFNGIKQ